MTEPFLHKIIIACSLHIKHDTQFIQTNGWETVNLGIIKKNRA